MPLRRVLEPEVTAPEEGSRPSPRGRVVALAAGCAAAIGLAAAPAGCDRFGGDSRPEPPTEPPPRPPANHEPPDLDAALAALASASASANPPAVGSAASSGAEAPSLAGTWEGRYDAKKAPVLLPPKVKDKTHASDDGKAAVGAGTLTLTVGPGGEVRGRSKGVLGEATLTGKAEGAYVRASFMPDDPTAGGAMTGVLVARLEDGKLEAQLRAAGPDAAVVREASFALQKK
jgi:hypothetical protein